MTIDQFVKDSLYFDRYKYLLDWKGYRVYDVWRKADEGACIGYPSYALEKDGNIRQASLDQVMMIMSLLDDED